MGSFVFGTGSGYPGYWMGLYFSKASDSAAMLASGRRVVDGKSGAADMAVYDLQKSQAVIADVEARSSAYRATQASADAQRIDAAAQLVSRASEGGVSADEKAALEAQAQKILGQVTSITTSVATVYEDLGEIAGVASALQAKSIAQSAAASQLNDAAEGYISVDFAKVSAELSHYQVLQQSASAMVTQVNQSRAWVLSLLK